MKLHRLIVGLAVSISFQVAASNSFCATKKPLQFESVYHEKLGWFWRRCYTEPECSIWIKRQNDQQKTSRFLSQSSDLIVPTSHYHYMQQQEQ